MRDEEPQDVTLRLDERLPITQRGSYYRIYQKVNENLRRMGILFSPAPVDHQGNIARPQLPPRLSDLTPIETQDLLGQYGAYIEYVVAQVANLENEYDSWKRTRDFYKAEIRTKTTARGAAAQSDAVNTDPRYQELDRKEFEAKATFTLAKAVLDGASQSFVTVSRNITAQGQELERVGRETNVAAQRSGHFARTIAQQTMAKAKLLRPGS